MAKVLNLSEYRKQRASAAPEPQAPDSRPSYYCLRCNSDRFKLYPSGEIHCAHCGALMQNIEVAASRSATQ